MAEETNVAGRLLGTNKAQQAVDQFEHALSSLTDNIKRLNKDLKNPNSRVGGIRTAAGDVWNGTSNWSGWGKGRDIGGDVTFGGKPQAARQPRRISDGTTNVPSYSQIKYESRTGSDNYDRIMFGGANGGGASFSGRPGGSGGAGGRGNGGHGAASGAGGLAGAAVALRQYGERNLPNQVVMDSYTTWATHGGANARNARNAAFGGGSNGMARYSLSGISNGYGDATQGALIRAQVTGDYTGNTQRFRQFSRAQRQIGYIDPGLGASGSAAAAASIYSQQSMFRSIGFGYISPIGRGGNLANFGDIARDQVFRVTGRTQLTEDQLNATLAAGTGNIWKSVMARTGGDQDATNAILNRIRVQQTAQNYARQHGTDPSKIDSLLNRAAGEGQSARQAQTTLERDYGIRASDAQKLKNIEATNMSRSNDQAESFRAGLGQASEAVSNFTDAINFFLKKTGLGDAIGYGGGVSSGLSSMGGMMAGAGAGWLGAKAMGRVGGSVLGRMGGKAAVGRGIGAAAGGLMRSLPAAALSLGALGPIGLGIGAAGLLTYGLYKSFKANDPGDGVGGGALVGGGGDSGPGGHVTGGTGKSSKSVIDVAMQYLGMPYKWGGNNPKSSFDCSGLMQWSFKQVGVNLPRTAAQQAKVGKRVDRKDLQPGDMVFYSYPGGKPGVDHVGLYIGDGKQIAAPTAGQDVKVQGVDWKHFVGARRVLGAPASMGSEDGAGADNAKDMGDRGATWSSGGGTYGSTEEAAALAAALMGGGGAPTASRGSGGGSKGSGADDSTPSVTSSPSNPKGNAALGKKLAAAHGWTGKQWDALYTLWQHESNWRNTADNPKSTAYGIAQLLDSTWAGTGYKKTSDPKTQILAGLKYIDSRYGDPAKAWSFWQKNNWYDKGAWKIEHDENARVHEGEMIIPARQAETIRQALLKETGSANATNGGGLTIRIGQIVNHIGAGADVSEQSARAFSHQIVDAITEDNRIKKMQKGL